MENNVRKTAKVEDFSISKKDAEFIRSCTCKVTRYKDMEVIRELRKAGADTQDIIDIYADNNIGKYSDGYKAESDTYLLNLIQDIDTPLSQVIEKILIENGFAFRRNLLTDEIYVTVPGHNASLKYDDYVLSEVNKVAIDTNIGNRSDFVDVIRSMANKNAYHPIKEYFESLVWDGQDHIGKLSIYLKDEHEPITYPDGSKRTVIHAYLSRWFVGAVKRVYDNDTSNAMLVLHGKQGDGKSQFGQWLCPKKEWLIEDEIDPHDKDKIRSLREKLVWEVAELDATFKKADRSALKNILTKRTVTSRNPYDRMSTDKPVMTSFIGTINPGEDGFLNDPSGYRRFNVVEIESIDWNYDKDIDINQCWAQAYQLYLKGETGRLSDCEVETQKKINSVHEAEDLVESALFDIMDVFDAKAETTPIKATEIVHALQEYKDFKGMSKEMLNRRITSALIKNGFSKSKNVKVIHKQNYWVGLKLNTNYDRNSSHPGAF